MQREPSPLSELLNAYRVLMLGDDPHRVHWIDCVKGITITLVVLHHAVAGFAINPGLPEWFLKLYNYSLPIRMPLFFLVAGLFAQRSLWMPLHEFLNKKVLHFVYFYFLWSMIIFFFRFAFNPVTNHVTESNEIFYILWDPLETIWFIYALLISFVVVRATRSWPAVIILTFAATLYGLDLSFAPPIIKKFGGLFIFFASGMCASEWLRDKAEKITREEIIACVIAFVALSRLTDLAPDKSHLLSSFALSLVSAWAIIGLSVLGTRSGYLVPVSFIGSHSLYVYLMHFLPVAGTRIVLTKLEISDSALIILPLSVAAGVLFPILVYHLLRDSAVAFLFTRPSFFHVHRKGFNKAL